MSNTVDRRIERARAAAAWLDDQGQHLHAETIRELARSAQRLRDTCKRGWHRAREDEANDRRGESGAH